MLEKVVRAAKGKVRLVKIDIDKNPEIAQQLRIQSVPTVYAFVGGQPVTGFAGAQPESQIKALVDRLIGGAGEEEGDGLLEAARTRPPTATRALPVGCSSSCWPRIPPSPTRSAASPAA